MNTATAVQPSNLVPLPVEPSARPTRKLIKERFKIQTFTNKRTRSESHRVFGIKRDGTRVRQNFADLLHAQARQLELNTEYLAQYTDTALRATKLTETQLKLAEVGFIRLGNDQDFLPAIEHWLKTGRQAAPIESPRLDDAFTQFKSWLEAADFRDRTKQNLRNRVNVFANSVPNMPVADITPDTVFGYLEMRNVAKASKDNDRRALSRFFVFCMDRPRKWISSNPARKEKRERRTTGNTPSILSLADCNAILRAAEKHRRGRLAPYVALCLFGGLRPFEAARLRLEQINLKDAEIRLEPEQTKTKTGRVVSISNTLKAWLTAYNGKPVYPPNWRKDFDLVKAAAGYGNPKRLPKRLAEAREQWKEWPDDVLRHTAISHYFRNSGSYGLTAEQFGNSEAIIKAHYQGRVTSSDTKAFYKLMPKKKGSK